MNRLIRIALVPLFSWALGSTMSCHEQKGAPHSKADRERLTRKEQTRELQDHLDAIERDWNRIKAKVERSTSRSVEPLPHDIARGLAEAKTKLKELGRSAERDFARAHEEVERKIHELERDLERLDRS